MIHRKLLLTCFLFWPIVSITYFSCKKKTFLLPVLPQVFGNELEFLLLKGHEVLYSEYVSDVLQWTWELVNTYCWA